MALRDENCMPCRDGGPTLSPDKRDELLQELSGWQVVNEHHLHKRLELPDFAAALAWLNQAAAICEEQGHHADFTIGWGYIEIVIYTHKAQGLTRADIVLAAKLDMLPVEG